MKEFKKGKWDKDNDLYITGTVTHKTPSLGPADLCWDRMYHLAQVYLKKFHPFYSNDSTLFPSLPGYATHGEPFFIMKDGNPMDSKASILHPELKGKMSGECIRKSAVTNF